MAARKDNQKKVEEKHIDLDAPLTELEQKVLDDIKRYDAKGWPMWYRRLSAYTSIQPAELFPILEKLELSGRVTSRYTEIEEGSGRYATCYFPVRSRQ